MDNLQRKIIMKSLLVWLLILPFAILNGGLRNEVIEPMFGWVAEPISGIILCTFIFLLCLFLIPRLGNGNKKTYIVMGCIWIMLTIVIEFIIGFIEGNTFNELLAAYDITTGNLWVLVLIITAVSPYLSAKIKRIV
ncbi:MAG: hypothetical protein FWE24_05850 [Defluviitaleaceae bacterium]|nr:hypothetical protein [Defluviitaleaceae bacterium]